MRKTSSEAMRVGRIRGCHKVAGRVFCVSAIGRGRLAFARKVEMSRAVFSSIVHPAWKGVRGARECRIYPSDSQNGNLG